jgi:hypothetical protein
MAFTRQNYRMMREELLKTVYWKDDNGTPKRARRTPVQAAKSVVMLDLALLKAEIETGTARATCRLRRMQMLP